MQNRKLLGTGLVVLGLVLSMTLMAASPADARWPGKMCHCGFFDFNGNAFAGVPGLPYGTSLGDCFWITSLSGNKGRICSAVWNTCGTFEVTSTNGSRITWKARFQNVPFFGGGSRIETRGDGERAGPGATLAGVGMTKDTFFSPAVYYGTTMEAASAPASACPLKSPPTP